MSVQMCDAEARALATARQGGAEAALPQQAANAGSTLMSGGLGVPESSAAGLTQVTGRH